jgi:hypothetical protein
MGPTQPWVRLGEMFVHLIAGIFGLTQMTPQHRTKDFIRKTVDPLQMAHDKTLSLVVAYTDFSVKAIKVTPQMMKDAFNSGNLGWAVGTPPPAGTLGALLTDIEAQH